MRAVSSIRVLFVGNVTHAAMAFVGLNHAWPLLSPEIETGDGAVGAIVLGSAVSRILFSIGSSFFSFVSVPIICCP